MGREERANGLRWGLVVIPPDIWSQLGHDGRFHRRDQRLCRGRIPRPGNHAQVNAIGFGINAQIGIRLPEVLGDLFVHRRLGKPHGFDVARQRDLARDHLAQAGGDLVIPHGMGLHGRARHSDENFAGALDPPARGTAVGVAQKLGRGNQLGLLDIGDRHIPAPPLKRVRDLLDHRGIDGGDLSEGGSNALTREVVLGGTQPARGQHQVHPL